MVPSHHEPGFSQIYICDPNEQVNMRTALNGGLDHDIVTQLQDMIFNHNPFAHIYRRAADLLGDEQRNNFSIVIHSDRSSSRGHAGQFLRPASGEIAAVVPSYPSPTAYRDIVIRPHGQGLMHIDELHPLYDPLHYVLMFPRGEQGWCAPTQGIYNHIMSYLYVPINSNNVIIGRLARRTANPDDDDGDTYTAMRFYAYLLQDRDDFYMVYYGRLFHQYAVDMYIKVEHQRLRYIETHQEILRAESLQGVIDAMGNETAREIGSHIILPPSFTGGPRDMHARYQDAMAIVRTLGKPNLFITFTCNPQWHEITSALKPGQTAPDRPDLTNRVFKLKVRLFGYMADCLLLPLYSSSHIFPTSYIV